MQQGWRRVCRVPLAAGRMRTRTPGGATCTTCTRAHVEEALHERAQCATLSAPVRRAPAHETLRLVMLRLNRPLLDARGDTCLLPWSHLTRTCSLCACSRHDMNPCYKKPACLVHVVPLNDHDAPVASGERTCLLLPRAHHSLCAALLTTRPSNHGPPARGVRAQACLSGQLRDLWEGDVRRIEGGKPPQYMVTRYTYGATSTVGGRVWHAQLGPAPPSPGSPVHLHGWYARMHTESLGLTPSRSLV